MLTTVPLNSAADISQQQLQQWAQAQGFAQVAVVDVDLADDEQRLQRWLQLNYHGNMEYMARHGLKRSRPSLLVPGTCRVLVVRMDYWPDDTQPIEVLQQSQLAYISRYALGRDYHKVMRKRLQRLADQLVEQVGGQYRVFVDSAPVMERALARKAGLGWVGRHSLILNQEAGSYFFLGEIYTDIPLSLTDLQETEDACGKCRACRTVCPTQAIVEDKVVDARLCISYLTIENDGEIPLYLRPLLGNRIFGCDDCQLWCPWNRQVPTTQEVDFQPRHGLQDRQLLELFLWPEETFLQRTAGTPIRRIGFQRWLRNLAVGIGNGLASGQLGREAVDVLQQRLLEPEVSDLVKEHIQWAIQQLESKG